MNPVQVALSIHCPLPLHSVFLLPCLPCSCPPTPPPPCPIVYQDCPYSRHQMLNPDLTCCLPACRSQHTYTYIRVYVYSLHDCHANMSPCRERGVQHLSCSMCLPNSSSMLYAHWALAEVDRDKLVEPTTLSMDAFKAFNSPPPVERLPSKACFKCSKAALTLHSSDAE